LRTTSTIQYSGGPCVKARFVVVIDPVRALGHLDDEQRAAGMTAPIPLRVARHDGDVRLGLGVSIESDRKV
jgi:hypothetical protein